MKVMLFIVHGQACS